MKLTIDTTNRTIQIEQPVTIHKLLEELDNLNIEYTEYTLTPSYYNHVYPTYPIYPTYPTLPTVPTLQPYYYTTLCNETK